MKLHLVSLGCAKNLVDSEIMLGRLMKKDWIITDDPAEAEIIIINTCSFIESAVNESIDTILEMASFKTNGLCKRLIVAGCLPERFREQIAQDLPEVDVFLGTGAFDRIIHAAKGSMNNELCFLPNPNLIALQNPDTPRVKSSSHMAYIKIAEGCNRNCTYCIIPKLRGKQKSRPVNDIVGEVNSLIMSDVKELILIAQDTTSYGKDLCPTVNLKQVFDKISGISDNAWIRILYGHPESIEENIIKAFAEHHNICSYFDIPIQHVSKSSLKRMGRMYTRDDLCKLYDKIRTLVPDAALRTTIMVGFPGESDKDFLQLFDFVEDICFDHLGVFIYSDFEDLPSHNLSGHVPKDVAKDRYDQIMLRQKEISLKNNMNHIGRVYKVLVEEKLENDLFIGRTYFQAPEVDGITYVKSGLLEVGCFSDVRMTDALEYDLIGEPL